jgi:hypothetical protein
VRNAGFAFRKPSSDLISALINTTDVADWGMNMHFFTRRFNAIMPATPAMTISSESNVGIGTASPDVTGFGWRTLTIRGGTTSGEAGVLELQSPSTTGAANLGIIAFLDGSNRNAQISVQRDSSTTTGNMLFYTNAGAGIVERMRITSGGNVLIGNPGSDNGAKLQVNGGITVAGTSALADNELRVRTIGDANHAIVFNGTINGPLSYGYLGSGLGWTEGSSAQIALMNVREKVLIGTTSGGSSKLRIVGLPTSSSGLSSGDVWSDSGTLKIA